MPDNTGTIGNTHGVKDNKNPERKKPIRVRIKFWLEIFEIIMSVSENSESVE